MAAKSAAAKSTAATFDMGSILGTAEKPATAKDSKSKTPVLTDAPEQIREAASKLRDAKQQIKTLEGEVDMHASDLVNYAEPRREEICKKDGYTSSVKVPDMKGLTVNISWPDNYSKIPMEGAKTLQELMGDYFKPMIDLFLEIQLADTSDEGLTNFMTIMAAGIKVLKLIEIIGADKFEELLQKNGIELTTNEINGEIARFLSVSRWMKPNTRYTEDAMKVFTKEQRQAQRAAGILPYKPSCKI